jgi:hypothetical protein
MLDGAALFIAPMVRLKRKIFEQEQTEGCQLDGFSSGPLPAMTG